MKKDWTYYIGASALLVGLLVETALAISAVIFVLYEICYGFFMLLNWLANTIPVGALPLLFATVLAIGFGMIFYDHYHCAELSEEEEVSHE